MNNHLAGIGGSEQRRRLAGYARASGDRRGGFEPKWASVRSVYTYVRLNNVPPGTKLTWRILDRCLRGGRSFNVAGGACEAHATSDCMGAPGPNIAERSGGKNRVETSTSIASLTFTSLSLAAGALEPRLLSQD